MDFLFTIAQSQPKWLMPPEASVNAPESDWLFYFVWYLSVFFFVLIIALMVLFAWKYRRQDPEQQPVSRVSHSTALELAWTLPPLVIVIFIFWIGLGGFVEISNPNANALRVDVRANKWNWQFVYSNGYSDPELHVPVGQPVELVLASDDVIHSLFIPAFRVKRDVVPGRYTHLWFEATQTGVFPIFCAEYCGTQHSAMVTRIVIHPPGEYETWLADASRALFEELDPEWYERWTAIDSAEAFEQFKQELSEQTEWSDEDIDKLKPAFVEGQELYVKQGCNQCHALEPGVRLTGPSWGGVWSEITGGHVRFTNGQTLSSFLGPDYTPEDYIRESILNPQAKIVETYPASMSSYQGRLSERQIDAIIAYIRSLDQPAAH